MFYKEGWTDGNKGWKVSHKYLEDDRYPLCTNTSGRYRLQTDQMRASVPKNACKNCLRIDKARLSSRQRRGKKKKGV